jgi:hypothetical protein
MKKIDSTKPKSRLSKYFETRRQAFRSAKKDNDIPVGEQPEETIKPFTPRGEEEKLDKRNRRLYIFRKDGGMFNMDERVYIREDAPAKYEDGGEQGKHFNVGKKTDKLGDHYNFEK